MKCAMSVNIICPVSYGRSTRFPRFFCFQDSQWWAGAGSCRSALLGLVAEARTENPANPNLGRGHGEQVKFQITPLVL